MTAPILGLNVPQGAIRIGIPGYAAARDNRLMEALATPFRRQRDYWRQPDGSVPVRADAEGPKGQLTG